MERSLLQDARIRELGKMKRNPNAKTFSRVMAEGGEGRLFSSKAESLTRTQDRGAGPVGTEPIAGTAAADVGVEDMGAIGSAQLQERARQAAAANPHEYMRPTDAMDPRLYKDLADHFTEGGKLTEEQAAQKFAAWAATQDPETVAATMRIGDEQQAAKVEMAELRRLVPTWEADFPAVIAYAKSQGATDAEVKAWCRNPSAAAFQAMHERWRNATKEDARANARRHPRDLEAAGEYFDAAGVARPSAPTLARIKPDERAAMVREVGELGMGSGGEQKPGERGQSIDAAGRLFAKILED